MLLVLIDVYKGWILPLVPGYSTIRTVLFRHDLEVYYNAEWSPLSLTAQTFNSVHKSWI